MNRKTKSVYVCSNCGQDFAKWQGKCFNCGQWETITEMRIESGKTRKPSALINPAGRRLLSDCQPESISRMHCGFNEVDRVLGGGIVPGSVTLIGGDPGIGKSTLLLQVSAGIANRDIPVLYISGEESPEQISLRANRLGLSNAKVNLLSETSLEAALAAIEDMKPAVFVADSIQTMYSEELEAAAGSVSQVRECAGALVRAAKRLGVAMFLIGHVTKEGALAGPRVLEHMVDTVLYFEGDGDCEYRMLRVVKNRFGPTGELALLAMHDSGLCEISDTAELFLSNRNRSSAGSSFVPIREGTRVLAVELQALVNKTHFGLPQRVASGINPKKLSLITAVLERHAKAHLGEYDIFFNVAGGLSIAEPGADLGIAAALLSSLLDKPIKKNCAFLGEIGLGGEVRPVGFMASRLKELAARGFTHCAVPVPGDSADWARSPKGLTLISLSKIAELDARFFG
jgi:DNA repair protein RadA/Sms